MATPGRPPVPTELKRQRGTLRKDRLPSGEPIKLIQPNEPPPPPIELGELGRAFWERTYREAHWISAKTDSTLVMITADQIDERESLRAIVMDSPEDRRLRSSLRDLERALVSNLALLGFTPADRARLGFAEVKKESKLEELIRKREERERSYQANDN